MNVSYGFYRSALFMIVVLFFYSCGPKKHAHEQGEKMCIVATTGMIGDAVRNIVSDSAEVLVLMGPGVDPHLYKASYGDLRKLRNASVIIYNGLHLEGKMVEVFQKISKQKKTICMAAGLQEKQLRKTAQFAGNADPHIWFNVGLWRKAIQYMGTQIILDDSVHADFYRKNINAYLSRLDSLDAWVKKEISTIPEKKRVLITAHDAFGYFGDAYHIEVMGLQGISTLSDFGLSDISSLVSLISERKIKAVFVESSVPRKSIEAVVEGCLEQGHRVSIGSTLYSDAMGSAGTPEDNYIGMVRHNVRSIVSALK
jgi:manganese/zinc/iron transport system substrate-binding protein